MAGDLGTLASAVLCQAWVDSGAGTIRGTGRATSELDRAEAVRFLTSDYGVWQQSRKHWAEIAGICPHRLRHQALAALPSAATVEPEPAPVPTKLPRPGSKLAALVELLRRRDGISMDEMVERFGWSRVTCSTAVSGDLPHKYQLRGKRGPDGRYRLVEAA